MSSDDAGAMVMFLQDGPTFEKHWHKGHFSPVERSLGFVHAAAGVNRTESPSDDSADQRMHWLWYHRTGHDVRFVEGTLVL